MRKHIIIIAVLSVIFISTTAHAGFSAGGPPPAEAAPSVVVNAQAGPGFCRPIGRRVFFENCWWQRIRCSRSASRDIHRCISCPDLPGRRCPRGL